MIADPRWVARAQREFTPEQLRHPVYRAMAEALFAGAREAPPPSPPGPELAEAWEALARPPEDGPFDAEAAWSTAVTWIKDRPRRERLADIDRLIGLAGPEQKEQLFEEKRALLAAGTARFRRKALQAEREPT